MPTKSAHINKIVDFWLRNDYFKGISVLALKKHLLWKYDKKFTHLWIVEKERGRIIGSFGSVKTELLSNGRGICPGRFGIDLLVERDLGKEDRRCVFLKLFRNVVLEGHRQKKPEIVFSFPNAVIRDTFLRVGWVDVPVFFKYSKAITRRMGGHCAPDDVEFLSIKKFDRRWDDLWKKFSGSFSLIVSRGHAYLNWRYCKGPDNHYSAFLVMLRNEIKGYLVIREKGIGKRKVGHIVDFLVEGKNNELDRKFINKTISFLALRGCSLIDAHISHQQYKDIFLSLGFKEEKVDFFVFSRFPGLLNKFMKDTSAWFITSGDGDFEMES